MSPCAPSGVFDVFVRPGAKQIVCEGAQARGNVGVLADARRVLGEGCVAHVMAAVLDAPVPADPRVPLLWRKSRRRGDPEDGLATARPKSGRGIAPKDRALQAQHGFDELLPRRARKPRLSVKGFQLSRLEAIAAFGLAPRAVARLASRRSERELSAQARLVVLHLREQMISGRDDALKSFFDSARRRA